MLPTTWPPWKNNRTEADVKADNQDKSYKVATVSEQGQQLVWKCYEYFCKTNPKKLDRKLKPPPPRSNFQIQGNFEKIYYKHIPF